MVVGGGDVDGDGGGFGWVLRGKRGVHTEPSYFENRIRAKPSFFRLRIRTKGFIVR